MDLNLNDITAQLVANLSDFVARLPAYLLALAVFILFLWLAGRLSRWLRTIVNGRGRSKNAATVIALVARWGVVVLGVLIALSIALPSFRAGDLIQVLGISSVAIGFAFRDIFQNFLAGLIILLTDAFEIGDQIIVESEDLEGTVTDIQTRATTIRTYDDRAIIIPNATLFTNAVTINTATETLRSEQIVGISYHSDVDAARRVILQAISRIDGVLADPAPDVLVDDLASSSVNLRARWWTAARRSTVLRIKSDVVAAIKRTLDAHDIEIPFPIRTIYMRQAASAPATDPNGAPDIHGRHAGNHSP